MDPLHTPMQQDATGISHLLGNDDTILNIIAGFDVGVKEQRDKEIPIEYGPGTKAPYEVLNGISRLKKYPRIELTTLEKILRVVVMILTLGLSRLYQNYHFRKALFEGDEDGLQAAATAIRRGASDYLSREDLLELANQDKLNSLEFLAAQAKGSSTPEQCRRDGNGHKSCNCGNAFTAHLYSSGSWSSAYRNNSLKILDAFLKYHVVEHFEPAYVDGTCDNYWQSHGWCSLERTLGYFRGDIPDYQMASLYFKHGTDVQNAFDSWCGHRGGHSGPIVSSMVEFWINAGLSPNQAHCDFLEIAFWQSPNIDLQPYNPDLRLIRILLERGANTNERHFTVAIGKGWHDVIKLLIEFNAIPTAVTLTSAANQPHAGIMKDLLEHAAKHHVVPTQAMIDDAADKGHRDTLAQLLIHTSRAGIVPSAESVERAMQRRQYEIARLLVEHGGPITTAVMTGAVASGDVAMLESLVKIASSRGPDGLAALEVARQNMQETCQNANRVLQLNSILEQMLKSAK